MSNPEADRADSPPLDPDDRAIILARKSSALTLRFEISNDLAHLNEAIALAQEAIALAEWDGYQSQFHNNLGRAFRLRFIASRQDEDLNAAIQSGRQSLASSQPDSAGRPLFLANLSDTLAVKFDETGDEQILQEALQLARDAVQASAAGDAFRGEAISTLTTRLFLLYEHTGSMDSLSETITMEQMLANETAEDDSLFALHHHNLATSLAARYRSLDQPDDLDACIRHSQKAVDVTDVHDANYFMYATGLLDHQHVRANRTGDRVDIDQTVTTGLALLEQDPSKPDRFRLLISLVRALCVRYDKTSSIESLTEAIAKSREAAAMSDLANQDRSLALIQQCRLLQRRDGPGDAALAVEVARLALDATSESVLPRIDALNNLSIQLSSEFDHTGQLATIDEAIGLAQQVNELAPHDHHDRAAWLSNLGILWGKRATVTEADRGIDRAIELKRQAISIADVQSPDLPMFWNGLSNSLADRNRLTSSTADLEEAVRASRAAVASTKPGETVRLRYINGLANRLRRRYYDFKQSADLDEAIAIISEVVLLAPDDDTYLMTLSNALATRFEKSHNFEDLERSIGALEKSCHLLDKGHPGYVRSLHNLGLRLMEQFQWSSRKDYPLLERAISIAQECVDRMPAGHSDLPNYLNMLGTRLVFRGEMLGVTKSIDEGLASFDEAISVFLRCFKIEEAPPQTRILAGSTAGFLMDRHERWMEAYEILRKTVQLFPRVSARSLPRGDQQRVLHGLSGISTDACSAALCAGVPAAEALEVLEAGRGIIAGLAMNVRNDLSDLAAVKPELALCYEKARAMADAAPSTDNEGSTPRSKDLAFDYAKCRQQNIARLEDMEGRIRLLPGFERFQLPPTSAQLMDLARSGPLVCFNVSLYRYRSDALLITAQSIESIPLPDLHLKELKSNVQRIIGPDRLSRAGVGARAKSNKEMRRILRWLWDVAVHPVLRALDLLQPDPAVPLPRLWWVTSGYMGLAPLHAAGDYDKPSSTACTAALVVSSYIPTLKALAYARDRQVGAQALPSKDLLVVSMPTTPGDSWAPLNVDGEIAAIERSYAHAEGVSCQLTRPSAADVLDRLKSHSIVHFACHGDPDADDPSESALILRADETTIDRLSVRQLSEATQAKGQLAYLSACCTAQHYSTKLMDEVIHLGSAFQLVGFPSVVGTLWEADDRAAASVAEAFYEEFAVASPESTTADVAARALHKATLKVRDTQRGRIRRPDHDALGWAPFIHIGA